MFEIGKRYRRTRDNIVRDWRKGDIGKCIDVASNIFLNERTNEKELGFPDYFDPTPIEEPAQREWKPGDRVRRMKVGTSTGNKYRLEIGDITTVNSISKYCFFSKETQLYYFVSDFELVADAEEAAATGRVAVDRLFYVDDGSASVEVTLPESAPTIPDPQPGIACIVRGSVPRPVFGQIAYREDTPEERTQKANTAEEYRITNERMGK